MYTSKYSYLQFKLLLIFLFFFQFFLCNGQRTTSIDKDALPPKKEGHTLHHTTKPTWSPIYIPTNIFIAVVFLQPLE